MNFPEDLKYSKEHEWIKLEKNIATIGITSHAAEQLGDVVMVEFPEVGQLLKKDESFGVVESVKSVSDVYAPIGGKVVEVNSPLTDSPGVINEDSFGEGWLVKLEISDKSDLDGLMNAADYQKYVSEEN